AVAATFQPRSAKSRAVALPIPDELPVMRTVRVMIRILSYLGAPGSAGLPNSAKRGDSARSCARQRRDAPLPLGWPESECELRVHARTARIERAAPCAHRL